jgi:hypothetical protein
MGCGARQGKRFAHHRHDHVNRLRLAVCQARILEQSLIELKPQGARRRAVDVSFTAGQPSSG